MDRTTYLNIAGKEYPMRFSMGVSIKIAERYGNMKGFQEVLLDGEDEARALREITWVIATLVAQGCAYKNLFEKDITPLDNAPVKDGKYVPLTEEELMMGLDLAGDGMNVLKMKIFECLSGGNKREVEEKEEKSEKNAETTQE